MATQNPLTSIPTRPAVHIRRATKGDLERVALTTWLVLVVTGRSGRYRFRDVLHGAREVFRDAAKGEYLLACVGEAVVGQLKLAWGWDDLLGRTAMIEHVFVHDGYRGLGVYDRLHEHAVAIARGRHAKRVALHVVTENARAARAYEKQGMQRTGHWMTQELDA